MGNRVETYKLSEEVVHQAAAHDATAKTTIIKITFLRLCPEQRIPPAHQKGSGLSRKLTSSQTSSIHI